MDIMFAWTVEVQLKYWRLTHFLYNYQIVCLPALLVLSVM